MTLDFDTDPFLKLLTDALRAGPGSPQWHEALTKLNSENGTSDSAAEFRLLCDARAHLESGREFRSIRAGAGFTRKVMEGIETDGTQRGPRTPMATIVATIASLLVIGVIGAIIYVVVNSSATNSGDAGAIEKLESTVMGFPVTSVTFDRFAPTDWKTVGKLPLEISKGMRGGGLVYSTPIPPDAPFTVESELKVNKSTDGILPEVAVGDVQDFSDDTATGSHELVWMLEAGVAKVLLPGGRMQAQADLVRDPNQAVTVRIRVDQRYTIVEMNGKRIWAGPNGLSTDKPRYVAIRLLRRGNEKKDQIVFQSVRVLQ